MLGIPRRVFLLLAFAIAAGVVVAGVATPVFGGLSLAAQRGVNYWDSLPSALDVPTLPAASKIYTANGHLLATFYYQNRIPAKLSEIPKVMQQAIVAIEDDRFYQEKGFDLRGLVRAAVNDATGGARQGASTLTQQYVKNILLDEAQTPAQRQAADAPTLHRKLQEARYAVALAQRLSKAQILEGYLNIAYFGDGAYGVGAAAEHYFGEQVQKLDLAQSALLAGIVEDPSLYDPAVNPKPAKARRDTVLNRMAQLHVISQAQASAAEGTPITLHVTQERDGCVGTAVPYFCDYVVHEVLQDPAFGKTASERAQLLDTGGLEIFTTLSPKDQVAAQQAIQNYVPWNAQQQIGAAEVMVQPGTGAIQAMAVNAPYGPGAGHNSVNWAADKAYGSSGGFQAGSSFKVFTLAAALEEGIPLYTTYASPSVINPPGLSGFTDCFGDSLNWPGPIHDAEGEAGTFNVMTGTWASVNTFYAQLELKTGLCRQSQIAGGLGVTQASGHPLQQVPSMVLGSNDVSPVDMAGAYAAFAASGKFCPPHAIAWVVDRAGHEMNFHPPACSQVVPKNIADTVTNVLTGVLDQPTGTGAGEGIGRPAAGKTGTIDNFHQAWFDGYTPQLAAAVWVGYPNSPNNEMSNVNIGGRYYTAVYGATIPAPIWHQSMTAAMAGLPVENFPPPDQSLFGTPPAPPAPPHTSSPAPTPSPTHTRPAPSPPAPKPTHSSTLTPPPKPGNGH